MIEMTEFLSKSVSETAKVACDFVEKLDLVAGKNTRAVVVGLTGDLGSGKTAFTKEVAKKLGVSEIVTSPTFVIEKIYKLSGQKFDHLIHIDAYRLERGEELLRLGWEEISSNPRNVIFIEWPEQVENILPGDMIKIEFRFIDENSRSIKIPMIKLQ